MRILWIPHTGWHIPQRAHHFCRALADRHEVHVTDWVADFENVRDYLSPRYVKNFSYRRYRDGQVRVHGIPRFSPALYSARLRRINQEIFSRFVQQIIARHDIEVVVGTFLIPPPVAPRLVLDLFDDNPAYWREFRSNATMAAEIAENELAWAKKSEQIVVVSSVLKEKVIDLLNEEERPPIDVIPNGVSLQKFAAANGRRIRNKLKINSGQQVVGFISGLGEFSGLLRYLAAVRHMQQTDIVHLVVGDGALLPAARAFVEKRGLVNVKFTGRVDNVEVVDYFAALDVGVIPFDLAEFTHSAFPIKLVEYLACGVPVVSTPLREVMRLDLPGVLFADPEPRLFAERVEQALNVEIAVSQELTRFATANLVHKFERILKGE